MATPIEQLEAMRHLQENWDGYGAAAPQANVIDLAQEFAGLIDTMLRKSGTQPGALHVSPTRAGGIVIDWEDDTRQHEIELDPDGSVSFLHLNKPTGQIETRKFIPATRGVVQLGLLEELCQSIAA
jgi:hypothetical protein